MQHIFSASQCKEFGSQREESKFASGFAFRFTVYSLLLAIFSLPVLASAVTADFFVATTGDDAWSGKLAEANGGKTDGPFATLARARDAVRAINQANLGRDIVVMIRGGRYALAETVFFGLEDSGPTSHTVTYMAYPGEEPIFTSDVPVTGWTKVPPNHGQHEYVMFSDGFSSGTIGAAINGHRMDNALGGSATRWAAPAGVTYGTHTTSTQRVASGTHGDFAIADYSLPTDTMVHLSAKMDVTDGFFTYGEGNQAPNYASIGIFLDKNNPGEWTSPGFHIRVFNNAFGAPGLDAWYLATGNVVKWTDKVYPNLVSIAPDEIDANGFISADVYFKGKPVPGYAFNATLYVNGIFKKAWGGIEDMVSGSYSGFSLPFGGWVDDFVVAAEYTPTPLPSATPTPPPTPAVALQEFYYSFDTTSGSTIPDMGPNGKTGAMPVDAVTTTSMSGFGKALRFDGSANAYLDVTNFSGSYSSYSIAFWLKPSALANWNQSITSQSGAFSAHSTANGEWYCGTNNAAADRITAAETGSVSAVGQWAHLCFTYDASRNLFSFYVNGVLKVAKPMVAPAPFTGFRIGQDFLGGDNTQQPMSGDMDDFAFWAGTLDATAVEQFASHAKTPADVLAVVEPLQPSPPVEAQIPLIAQGKVWVANMPYGSGLSSFRTMYDGDASLQRARSAAFVPTSSPPPWYGNGTTDLSTLHFPAGAIRNWLNLHDVEIKIVPMANWHVSILPLATVNENTLTATTSVPCTYAIGSTYGPLAGGNVWVENVLDVLDEPGEWVVDTWMGKIYYWPKSGTAGDKIVAPRLKEFIRIEGDIDYAGPADTPVRNIVFKGITFMHGDRDRWDRDYQGMNLQHSWEMFDRGNAMVRMRGAEGCRVERCKFLNSGGAAVRLDLHCIRNKVRWNRIDGVGSTGILLAGYGPGTKNVNKNNEVANNELSNVGKEYWHAPAIHVWQSEGNRIANNYIHNVPYTGIVVSGRIEMSHNPIGECARTVRWDEIGSSPIGTWADQEPFLHARLNKVEYNEITDVVEFMADGNAIYVSGCGRDNIVRRNYIHDLYSGGIDCGIRCDDFQYETRVTENILFRLACNGIVLKQANDITNNFLVDIGIPGASWYFNGFVSLQLGPVQGSDIQRNIMYCTAGDKAPYWEGTTYGMAAYLRETNADYNMYFSPSDNNWATAHLDKSHGEGIELHSVQQDPLFMDAANGDFRFKPGSPAPGFGIVPIDQSRIGLEKWTGETGAKGWVMY